MSYQIRPKSHAWNKIRKITSDLDKDSDSFRFSGLIHIRSSDELQWLEYYVEKWPDKGCHMKKSGVIQRDLADWIDDGLTAYELETAVSDLQNAGDKRWYLTGVPANLKHSVNRWKKHRKVFNCVRDCSNRTQAYAPDVRDTNDTLAYQTMEDGICENTHLLAIHDLLTYKQEYNRWSK